MLQDKRYSVEKKSLLAKILKHSKAMGKIIFGADFLNNIKSIAFLSMILSMITPVLGSLTATYANETIILDYASKSPNHSTLKSSFDEFHCSNPCCWLDSLRVHPPDILRLRPDKPKASVPSHSGDHRVAIGLLSSDLSSIPG